MALPQTRAQGSRRVEIGKGLIHDQPTASRAKVLGEAKQGLAVEKPAIGIVGIDDDHDIRAVRAGPETRLRHVMPGLPPGMGMLRIGRAEHRHP